MSPIAIVTEAFIIVVSAMVTAYFVPDLIKKFRGLNKKK